MAKSKKEVAVTDGMPAFLANYDGPTGTENIDNDDITIPRIKLGQGLTPEVKAGTVKDGDLFLNVTGEVFATAGEKMRVVVMAVGKEHILWNPTRSEGILARAFPVKHNGETRYEWDKQDETFQVKFKNGPQVTWETKRFVDENGMDKWGSRIPGDKDSGPASTLHYNYVVCLPNNNGTVAAMSLSRSQIKRAKELNTILNMPNSTGKKNPVFLRYFDVEATPEKNDDGDFFNYKFFPAGFVQDADEFAKYAEIAKSFGQGFKVDQSNEDDEDATAGTSI